MTKQAIVAEPLVENGNVTNEKQSIWASILRDVKSSTKKAPATKSLVVLGDNESGRTTLVAKLQGNDDPKRGAGLEYHYIDIKDDDRDDTPKLGVWILDGDVACSAPLLKFAMKSETIENTILILVASMTHPWSLLSTLKKWIVLIEEHIDRLQIDPIRLREMRDHLQYDFQHYIEPNDTSIMLTSSASSTTLKSGIGGGRVPSSVSSVSLASTTPLSPTINGDEQVVLPLADGVLTKSLGIPVIVVITKCDTMPTLEKENDYKDEYFDFMQHHLRKFCLEYGAALFYTSVKEKKNIDKLYKYIVYKCYGYPFLSTAAIVERDAIFIPAGWDNPKKAEILLENLHRLKSTDNYSDVFVKPVVRRPLQRDNEIITAEDDQEFLGKLQLTLNRAASPGRTDENATPVLTRTSGGSGGGGSQTPSVSGRPRNQPNASPVGANTAANEGALANFFNSLLTRKSGGAVTPTGPGAPGAQRQTSQSPTTPSSKRLQQHPLTFAVTPPTRTRTPTSHKTYPSLLNVESPPTILSPVDEQQNKVETITVSPTVVRTPLGEIEPLENVDNTEDKQFVITNSESMHLNNTEKQVNDTLRSENESITNVDQQNTEPVTSQHNSVSNSINNSHGETLNSSSRASPINEKESNVEQISLKDERDRRLSNDFSLSQSITTINSSLLPNQSRSSSPVIDNDNKILNRSSSSSNFENSEQLDNKEDNEKQMFSIIPQDKALRSSVEDIPSNNSNEEQQDDLKPPLNSSRRNSLINSSIRSRPTSPTILETSEGSSTHQTDNSSIPIEAFDENSLTIQSPRLLSTSEVNIDGHEQQDRISTPPSNTNANQNHLHSPVEISEEMSRRHSADNTSSSLVNENHHSVKSPLSEYRSSSPTNGERRNSLSIENNLQQSPTHERPLSPSFIPENLGPTKVTASPTLETADITLDSYKVTPSLPIAEEKDQRSQSPSSITQKEQQRSRSPSPIGGQKDERSRSLSPINIQKRERSRTPSPIVKQEQQKSRSASPINQQELQRSRSPSPVAQQEHEGNRPSSPITKQEQERSRSPSPLIGETKGRGRSRSPSVQQNQQKGRSPSISIDQNQERSRSSSPSAEQKEQQSPFLTSSTVDKQKEQRSRSPSPIPQQEQQRTRSPSPIIKQEQQRSRSPSPIVLQEEHRSQTISFSNEEKQKRSRSPSPAHDQSQQRSPSTSSLHENQQKDLFSIESLENKLHSTENENSLSRTSDDHETEIQSTNKVITSPTIDNQQEQQLDTLTSPKSDNQRKYSSSQIDNNALNSPSHTIEPEQQVRSRSSSPTVSENRNHVHDNEIRSLTPSSSKNENQVFENEQYKSEETNKNDQISSNNDEKLQKSPLSSPLIEKHIVEPLRIPSPADQQEALLVKTKSENQTSPLISPLSIPFTENPSNESIPSSMLEKQGRISPIIAIDQEQSNLFNSSALIEPISPTKRPSVDRSHESNSSTIPTLSADHRLSITRSRSQSTLIRPNTLHFSPNEHNLDGLYMSNDYNDEDEIPEDNEHHHNSAPSTVNVEYRRSSLLHDNNFEQRHTPLDPIDILKRLSLVEKSRMEDNDNSGVDSTTSKDT